MLKQKRLSIEMCQLYRNLWRYVNGVRTKSGGQNDVQSKVVNRQYKKNLIKNNLTS